MMNIDEIVKKAKDLISEQNLTEAKKFIEEHKNELGEHYDKLIQMVSSNAENQEIKCYCPHPFILVMHQSSLWQMHK